MSSGGARREEARSAVQLSASLDRARSAATVNGATERAGSELCSQHTLCARQTQLSANASPLASVPTHTAQMAEPNGQQPNMPGDGQQPNMPGDAPAAAADDTNNEGTAPTFASAADQQAFQSALLAQMQSAASVSAARLAVMGDAAAVAAAPSGSVSPHIDSSSGRNAHTVLCRFCDTKIFLADAGTYVQKDLELHTLGGAKDDPSKDALSHHWLLTSQMHFENVGVTRSVDPAYRYLTCASCDRGPIGINFMADLGKFYVAHDRVKYEE